MQINYNFRDYNLLLEGVRNVTGEWFGQSYTVEVEFANGTETLFWFNQGTLAAGKALEAAFKVLASLEGTTKEPEPPLDQPPSNPTTLPAGASNDEVPF